MRHVLLALYVLYIIYTPARKYDETQWQFITKDSLAAGLCISIWSVYWTFCYNARFEEGFLVRANPIPFRQHQPRRRYCFFSKMPLLGGLKDNILSEINAVLHTESKIKIGYFASFFPKSIIQKVIFHISALKDLLQLNFFFFTFFTRLQAVIFQNPISSSTNAWIRNMI